MNLVCVQYGCGFSAPDNWINYDSSPTLRFEKLPFIRHLYVRQSTVKKGLFPRNILYGDIIKGLPLEKNSVDRLYCSHVLEHLSYKDCLTALENSYYYLKPGGIFRLVLPDLSEVIQSYLNDNSVDASHHLMKSSYLGKETRPRTFKQFIFEWFSNAGHLWLWDEKAMNKALVECGFSSVKRAFFEDNKDSAFNSVEEKHRWSGCLGFEVIK